LHLQGNYALKPAFQGRFKKFYTAVYREHFCIKGCFPALPIIIMRFLLILLTTLMACSQSEKPFIPTGTWRAVLELQGQELPFTFDLEKKDGQYVAWIRNGQERLYLDEVYLTADSVTMNVHIFDAVFKAARTDHELTGVFIIQYADDYQIPFRARHGENFRFVPTDTTRTVTDFSGKYAVKFFNENSTVDALGIFTQKGNYAQGTFLTPTGDYRYLEGNVVDDTLWLSGFDGNHLYLFKAVKSGDTLSGTHWLGKSRNRKWTGVRNDQAQPPATESLTYLKDGYTTLEFTFPDVNGKPVSLQDERYKNKVVILQILGSWCPNCMDETRFLSEWYAINNHRGIEIIGLAFEQKAEFEYASGRVKKMKEKLGVPYPVLIAGTQANASQTLPALNRILAFPTTIFVGKDGQVKHIHTGFSGPGTGVYYDQQKERFNKIVNELLTSR
jgi:thiol-disulfide isomerase/thioredoxin